jgi:hypothetical protein
MPTDNADVMRAMTTVLREVVDGAARDGGWLLNRSDQGLLRSLGSLSAAAASTIPQNGGSSIAAHVDHIRYGLELFNRWSRGEKDPFTGADWSASWDRVRVSEAEWAALRGQLAAEAHAWLEAVQKPRELSQEELTGILASVAHMAYHLGAIRQIDSATRGPRARD